MDTPQYHLPDLETERLVLRPYGLADFDALRALYSNAEVVRYLYGEDRERGRDPQAPRKEDGGHVAQV